jgi:HKD family nuclease
LYNCFNSKRALQVLSNLANESKGKILVRISRETKFHWKYYHFEVNKSSVLYVGSANLTRAGMNELGELQAKITSTPRDANYLRDFKSEFNKEWENAVDITKFPISKYKQHTQPRSRVILHPDIQNLLAHKKVDIGIKTKSIEGIILTRNYLSKTTDKLIERNQSHWESNNWEYYSCASKREFDFESKQGRVMLLIEKRGNQFRFSRIRIEESCVLSTPDGKYFIAYRRISKFKRETNELRELADAGVNYHSRKFSFKYKLSKKAVDIVNKIK